MVATDSSTDSPINEKSNDKSDKGQHNIDKNKIEEEILDVLEHRNNW